MSVLPDVLISNRPNAKSGKLYRFVLTYERLINTTAIERWVRSRIESYAPHSIVTILAAQDESSVFTHVFVKLNEHLSGSINDSSFFIWHEPWMSICKPILSRFTTNNTAVVAYNYITDLTRVVKPRNKAPITEALHDLIQLFRPWQCALFNILELRLLTCPVIIYSTVPDVGKTWLCKTLEKYLPVKYWSGAGEFRNAKTFLIDLPADDVAATAILTWLSQVPSDVQLCIFANRPYIIPFQGMAYQVTSPIGLLEVCKVN